MNLVKPKKHLGQHFLKDESIARRIAEEVSDTSKNVLEIGPGMGVLTKYLLKRESIKDLRVVEIDRESVEYLNNNYPELRNKIFSEDFLRMNLKEVFNENYTICGNFPYNISSQILFKVFDNKSLVDEVVGMFQKEVAQRVASEPGNKVYGILSVLLRAYYDIEYLFTVDEDVFFPPPKVKSGVIRLKRNNIEKIDCDEALFLKVVKTGFNQRRKMLRSSLKPLNMDLSNVPQELLSKRAEQLSVNDFIYLTNQIK